jgi:Fe-S cluster assembly scaffold protein SufB
MSKPGQLSREERKGLERVGYDDQQQRSGTFLAADHRVVEAKPFSDQVEILPLSLAIKDYDWVSDLLFGLVDSDKDAYTRMVKNQKEPLGYFIRVKEGQEVILPLQTCFYIRVDQSSQVIHNIVVAEPGSTLHLISGCVSDAHVDKGRHVGVTEYYIGEGATVDTTMIHSWGPNVTVYPRAAAHVKKGGRFISNYVVMSPVKYIQMAPEAVIEEGGLGEFYSIIYAPEGSCLDIGGKIRLAGEQARAEIISRVVSDGGKVVTRGCIVGEVDGVQGTMACNGLLVSPRGSIHAIPELEGKSPLVLLSHEASVGMISQDELSYLMASGISEERARELIIQGFLEVRIKGLPDALHRTIARMIKKAKAGEAV